MMRLARIWRPCLCTSFAAEFMRGYLDVELVEKLKVMDPELYASSFRMLQEFGVKSGLSIKVDEKKVEYDLQKAELNTAAAKLNKEQKKFLDFRDATPNFTRAELGAAGGDSAQAESHTKSCSGVAFPTP